ncbi:Pentatricopeptide repeat-containing protein [Cladobotryum mycophilum]|uniref:Pentatricopeptide repeat-containing protein n=1 Tax=Cladobotryum mycophilum TaxID=491253 RepID=A0ABR0S9I3_9HYPO
MSGSICLRRAVHATSRNAKPLLSVGALLGSTSSLSLRQASSRQYATTTAIASTIPTTPTDAPQSLDAKFDDSAMLERKNRERLERIVKKHLDLMEDPWHIAQYVEQTLKRDRFDEALLLTQKASNDAQVVVAWNHLINYQLNKDRLKPAIKLYNEMKKRGQLPNVQTFTIIFRGCARSNHPKLAVAEAIKHYNILLNDTRLQPNSIHLNAVLNVCARAGDLDSMFLMVDSINDSTRAPTAYTYTTIFNAMRHQAIQNSKDVSEEQQLANVQKIIDRAKSIWTEVIDKWTRGKLVIDEELVCAMGRLLLMSRNREEKRDILDLLQQTMNIPNLAKSPETDAYQDPDMQNIAISGVSSKTVPATKAVYAIPGRNSLALVLTILASAKLTTCGIKYWNLMVRHYGIVPDSDNWLRLFGMLKVARASAHAASILDILPDAYLGPKPFRIAMETCVRDNINQNAIVNANRVLDSMLNRLTTVPDLHTLRLYLRVALVSHYHMREMAQKGDEAAAKREYGMQITSALARLWDPYKTAHYHYFKVSKKEARTQGDSGLGELYNDKREVIALARHMFSAFNKVLNERMLPDEDLRELRPIGAKINREIQAFYANREELEPKLRQRSADEGAEGVEAVDVEEEEVSIKRGGDFVWNTTRPVDIMTRENRRQAGRDEEDQRRPGREEEEIRRPVREEYGRRPGGEEERRRRPAREEEARWRPRREEDVRQRPRREDYGNRSRNDRKSSW